MKIIPVIKYEGLGGKVFNTEAEAIEATKTAQIYKLMIDKKKNNRYDTQISPKDIYESYLEIKKIMEA